MIVRIEIDELFGQYTYRLQTPQKTKGATEQQLLLLYGDNGSGKTTIAQLLFHMLSRSDGRSHRTFLAKTKFRRFAVEFANGSTAMATRQAGNELIGPYNLVVRSPRKKEFTVSVSTSDDGAVKSEDVDEARLAEFFQKLPEPNLTAYFLSDNRVLQSDAFEDQPPEDWSHVSGHVVTRRIGDSYERMLIRPLTRDLILAPSIWRAEMWLRQQAIRASNVGEATMTNIYTDILKRISTAAPRDQAEEPGDLAGTMEVLERLAARVEVFTSFGLAQPVPLKDLRTIIQGTSADRRSLLASVLEPYVNSIRSRLDAYQALQRKLATFIGIVNSFYRRKSIRIDLSDGIQVFDEQGDELEIEFLSSGEKQLLLLLCNILVATAGSSLFIIDEPELSLNVKWQRELLDSLLGLVQESNVQFVMATHSIELLTRHKERVLQLQDLGTTKGHKKQ